MKTSKDCREKSQSSKKIKRYRKIDLDSEKLKGQPSTEKTANVDVIDEDSLSYCGVKSKPGMPIKFKSKYNIKKQALLHSEKLKQERKRKQFIKKKQEIFNKNREPLFKGKRSKQDIDSEEAKLNKLIETYHEERNATVCKKRWYDT